METTAQPNSASNWFVGASWGRDGDQTSRFLHDGIWENGYDDKYQDHVRSMRPGDRIVIKSAYRRKNSLPFDNRGNYVAVMAIKVIGTITENLNDGKRVRVDWEERRPLREWYFYTLRQTVQHVRAGVKWEADGLLAFTFNEEPQAIERFRNAPYWRGRFGDNANSGHESEPSVEPVDGTARKPDSLDQPVAVSLPDIQELTDQIEKAGNFPPGLCEHLHLGLWSNERRHFSILTGISGSGKTLLACAYGRALARGDESRFCIVPIQPGWTDPSFLLGYPNPLSHGIYEKTPFLRLLLRAANEPEFPHIAVLDEMNLSHPEQYLAPILSAMETGNELDLHGRDIDFDGVPRSIHYPNNLVLIGTVNMDETTMGLSDKVLDRAFTLEFWDISVDDWPEWDSLDLPEKQVEQTKTVLKELMDALKPARLHFGYRVIEEIVAFLRQRERLSPESSFSEALDSAIYAKVLPKLRGDDSKRVQDAFTECIEVLETHTLRECIKKVRDMKEDLESTGSVRFWR